MATWFVIRVALKTVIIDIFIMIYQVTMGSLVVMNLHRIITSNLQLLLAFELYCLAVGPQLYCSGCFQ